MQDLPPAPPALLAWAQILAVIISVLFGATAKILYEQRMKKKDDQIDDLRDRLAHAEKFKAAALVTELEQVTKHLNERTEKFRERERELEARLADVSNVSARSAEQASLLLHSLEETRAEIDQLRIIATEAQAAKQLFQRRGNWLTGSRGYTNWFSTIMNTKQWDAEELPPLDPRLFDDVEKYGETTTIRRPPDKDER